MADWREIPSATRWHTLKRTDEYLLQRKQRLEVDFDSGERRWKDVLAYASMFDDAWDVFSERIVRLNDASINEGV